ncbi:reverse transcriptase domain-containing protein [Flagellimonas sediminis]|uniref:RNA-directed DNA polymerase (Reverse transcriptase) n=1 Tax=Flagellimonas sediminis TaxID=2696468 RepID=A0A6I5KSS2_9FLAO|nr:reverse transcriptase domain-containing protein [Allomuricauda sediminis]NDV43974.1 RNA-directed DNA polymerase (Reverse transcriptase) [Allomuricauda sediminis]
MIQQKDWFKERAYPHFTNKTPNRIRKGVEKYIKNQNKVTTHSFSPLIFKEIKQRRYKLSEFNGELRRSHKKTSKNRVQSTTKIREILYSTHIDSHIYSYYTQKIIGPKYEEHLKKDIDLDLAITAYRRVKTKDSITHKNNVHFAKDVFDEIKQRGNCAVLAFDIENFFPSLNHKLLKTIWCKILGCKSLPEDHYNLFKAVTNYSYVRLSDLKVGKRRFDEKKLAQLRKEGRDTYFKSIKDLVNSDIVIHKNQKKKDGATVGIPQGLPISALLANIYMLPFDFNIIESLVKGKRMFYRRYSDDIVLICNLDEIEQVVKTIGEEIRKIKLKISVEKKEVTIFKEYQGRLQSFRLDEDELKFNHPLCYLGFEFYGYQTLIKSKNLATFYREMKMAIKRKDARVNSIKEKYLLDEAPIFKTKIYRLYSHKGTQSRRIPTKRIELRNGSQIPKSFKRKYRGNFIKYAYSASDIMEAPEIKKQLRRHSVILRNTLTEYDYSNVRKIQSQ